MMVSSVCSDPILDTSTVSMDKMKGARSQVSKKACRLGDQVILSSAPPFLQIITLEMGYYYYCYSRVFLGPNPILWVFPNKIGSGSSCSNTHSSSNH